MMSMTGFGRAVVTNGDVRWVVDVRSVNSRYMELRLYGFLDDYELEFSVGKLVKEHFQRGKIDITLRRESAGISPINEKKIREHYLALNKLREELHIRAEVDLNTLLTTASSDRGFEIQDLKTALAAVKKALEALEASRAAEGKVLTADISMRIRSIRDAFKKIEDSLPDIYEKKKLDSKAKIAKLLQEVASIDAARVDMEIALILDRSDVTEEVVRFLKHLTSFEELIQREQKGVGRELDFILQELNREINTLGSKVGNFEISQIVVSVKSELEKIREQVQNIE